MPPALPLITLLTDFGTKDHFVASMKGVILSINPHARIIDITHDISPFRIADAAFCLSACYRTFPAGTVHVAVVDPGVGSSRRPVLVTTSRYYFVAPDNGVLTPVLAEEQAVEIRHLENLQYQLESPGATFHGRDLFAPAAAWLSKGLEPSVFGRLICDPITIKWQKPIVDGTSVRGEIVYVDHFGNLISNLTTDHVEMFRLMTKRSFPLILVGGQIIDGFVGSYREGNMQVPRVLINSNGQCEIFIKEGSAERILNLSKGAPILFK